MESAIERASRSQVRERGDSETLAECGKKQRRQCFKFFRFFNTCFFIFAVQHTRTISAVDSNRVNLHATILPSTALFWNACSISIFIFRVRAVSFGATRHFPRVLRAPGSNQCHMMWGIGRFFSTRRVNGVGFAVTGLWGYYNSYDCSLFYQIKNTISYGIAIAILTATALLLLLNCFTILMVMYSLNNIWVNSVFILLRFLVF